MNHYSTPWQILNIFAKHSAEMCGFFQLQLKLQPCSLWLTHNSHFLAMQNLTTFSWTEFWEVRWSRIGSKIFSFVILEGKIYFSLLFSTFYIFLVIFKCKLNLKIFGSFLVLPRPYHNIQGSHIQVRLPSHTSCALAHLIPEHFL